MCLMKLLSFQCYSSFKPHDPNLTLTVTRIRGWYGKVRKLHIYAKTPRGKWRLGAVKHGQSVEVQVPHDATQIYGKMDWCKSLKMDLAFG